MGSVSGGCVEAAVVAETADVLSSGMPKTLQFGLEHGTAWKVGLVCGGTIRIFVEPLEERGRAGAGVLQRLASDIEARREVALVTELATGTRSLAHGPDELGENLASALVDAFQHDRSVAVQGRHGEAFIYVFNIYVFNPVTRLIVVGAVHPRSAFATVERFGDVSIMHDWPDEALRTLGLDAHTAVVVLSHDAKLDDAALISALRSEAFYVGALGSRKTRAARIERLTLAGVNAVDIARINAPVGLDIGAQGPPEIALSIIAQTVAVQRGKAPAHP